MYTNTRNFANIHLPECRKVLQLRDEETVGIMVIRLKRCRIIQDSKRAQRKDDGETLALRHHLHAFFFQVICGSFQPAVYSSMVLSYPSVL